mgnify:CR=1 FL=1
MYTEDEESPSGHEDTDTNVALDNQHGDGESPLRRSNRISRLPNQPKYKLSDYYDNMSSDDESKCSDDYAHGSDEEVFGGSDSDAESIHTATYISSGDDNEETQDSPVTKEVTVKVKLETNTSQGDLEESAPDGDHVEHEMEDETRGVGCDANSSNQDIHEGQDVQEGNDHRHADGQDQVDQQEEINSDDNDSNQDIEEVREVLQQEEHNGLNLLNGVIELLEDSDNEQQLQEQHGGMARENRNRDRGQTSLDYSFQFAVHKTD